MKIELLQVSSNFFLLSVHTSNIIKAKQINNEENDIAQCNYSLSTFMAVMGMRLYWCNGRCIIKSMQDISSCCSRTCWLSISKAPCNFASTEWLKKHAYIFIYKSYILDMFTNYSKKLSQVCVF